MNGFAQNIPHDSARGSAFVRNARAGFMGSYIMQSIGVAADRLDTVHTAMLLRLVDENSAEWAAKDEADQLAAHIVAVERIAAAASDTGGSQGAMEAVMRESGISVDPMIAQNFLKLASSPIFWMAMDAAGGANP